MLLIPRHLPIIQQRATNSVRHNLRNRRNRSELRIQETCRLERDTDDRRGSAIKPVEKPAEVVRVRVPLGYGVATDEVAVAVPEDAPPVFARCEEAGVVGDLAGGGLFVGVDFLPDAFVGVDVAVFVQEADAADGVRVAVYYCDEGGALGGAEGEGEEEEDVEEGVEEFGGLHFLTWVVWW